MAKHKLIVNSEGSETRVGVLEEGVLTDYFLERKRDRGIIGNIYKGRVSRVLPGMQAAFVDLGRDVERKAYLYVADVLGAGDEKKLFAGYDDDDDDSSDDEDGGKSSKKKDSSKSRRPKRKDAAKRKIEDLLKEGQDVIVQITKEPVGQKGARITGYVSLPGRHSVLMPTIDRVGVSHRVDSSKERKRLRDIVKSQKPDGVGFILRTAASGAHGDEVKDDVDYLVQLWDQIGKKQASLKKPGLLYSDFDMVLRSIRDLVRDDTAEWIIDNEEQYDRAKRFAEAFMPRYVDRIKLYQGRQPIFDSYNLTSQLRSALRTKVPLRSGGSLVIEQGEALTAIDINTGSFTGSSSSLEETITANNLEACKEIALQLRLRNIGGIIVVDFVDMDKAENRRKVWDAFSEALASDPSRANLTRISELGLVEMTRKRTRESLTQVLTDPCPTCSGSGRINSTTTVAYEVLRHLRRLGPTVETETIDIQCTPKVADLLDRYERDYLDQMEKKFFKKVTVTGVDTMSPEEFTIAGIAPDNGKEEDAKPARKKRGGRSRGKSSKSSGKNGEAKKKRSSRGSSKSKGSDDQPTA